MFSAPLGMPSLHAIIVSALVVGICAGIFIFVPMEKIMEANEKSSIIMQNWTTWMQCIRLITLLSMGVVISTALMILILSGALLIELHTGVPSIISALVTLAVLIWYIVRLYKKLFIPGFYP